MRQDVNKIDFWKDRIETAKEPWHSVYLANPLLWKYILDTHRRILRRHIRPEDNVLDAACGYGRMSEYIENYTGVDFSPDFIEWAKKDHPDKTFIQADIKNLPFRDEEFDWAFCISLKNMIRGYESQEAWDIMEKELKRVSKKVLILEYSDPDQYEIL